MARSGKAGEREQWALTNGYSGGGFSDVKNFTGANTRELVLAAFTRAQLHRKMAPYGRR